MAAAWKPIEGSKVDTLIKAMRAVADTRPIWSQSEAAQVMEVPRGNVPGFVAGACNAGALHRRTLAHGHGIELSLQPFPAHGFAPISVSDLPIPTFQSAPGFVPPQMTAPRAGSDVPHPKFAEGVRPCPPAAPSPALAEEPAPEVANPLEETGASPQTEAPASDNAVAESDEPLEEAGFDYCLWRDGGVQVWGVEQLADGSFKISMEQLIDMREAFELAAGRHARGQAA